MKRHTGSLGGNPDYHRQKAKEWADRLKEDIKQVEALVSENRCSDLSSPLEIAAVAYGHFHAHAYSLDAQVRNKTHDRWVREVFKRYQTATSKAREACTISMKPPKGPSRLFVVK